MVKKEDKLLSVTEAAEILGVNRQRTHQLIKDGRLNAQMVGSQWVIKESDLEAVKDRPTGRPPKDSENK
ncbi:MAG: helix-turn-helix domain-containing protein [Pyrinomonadaceae bacterium]